MWCSCTVTHLVETLPRASQDSCCFRSFFKDCLCFTRISATTGWGRNILHVEDPSSVLPWLQKQAICKEVWPKIEARTQRGGRHGPEIELSPRCKIQHRSINKNWETLFFVDTQPSWAFIHRNEFYSTIVRTSEQENPHRLPLKKPLTVQWLHALTNTFLIFCPIYSSWRSPVLSLWAQQFIIMNIYRTASTRIEESGSNAELILKNK